MLQKIKNNQIIRTFFSTKSLGLYLFLIISLSVAWSTAKIIQKNYELEQQIATLSREVEIQRQQNENQKIKNQYFNTDAYLELAARRYFLKALPGERMYAVPKEVALNYVKEELAASAKQTAQTKNYPFFIKNWQDWINFFQGKL